SRSLRPPQIQTIVGTGRVEALLAVEAVDSVAAAAPADSMNPEAWQALLAAELSPAKGRAILRSLGSSTIDSARAVFEHPSLSETERARISESSSAALGSAIAAGIQVVTEEAYPEALARCDATPPGLFV